MAGNWQQQNLRRRLEGLSEEGKANKIRELVLEDRMKEYRYNALKKYRDEHRGTFTTPTVV